MELNKIFNQSRYDTYVEHLKSLGLSDSSINRKLSSISSFHKYLVKKKKIDPTIPIKTRLAIPTNKPTPPVTAPKQPWIKYFLFSSVVILILGLGYTFFIQIFNRASKNLAFTSASNPITPNRILSFQGRLTDSSGNPITSSTSTLFKLYNSGTGGTELYTSGAGNSQTVIPDENGIFSVVIGKSHGLGIPSSVFSENADVWLEITAGGETMNPRQQIATVGYALNTETLQGLPPSASGFKNTVLVIDGSGNLNLGETSPTIYSQSGTLGIIGQALLIGTSDGSGGNITINPDGAGKLKLITEGTGSTATGGLIEATNANLASGNLYSAYINNDNRGYNFIDFSNYNIGTTTLSSRFSVSASGTVNISNNLNVGATVTFSGISLGSGSTALFIDNSGTLSKRSLGLLAFQDVAIGTTYSFSNGLTNSSGNVGLGGTLTSNTLINTNSNFLSFLGLGNSQSLFVGSSGFVGVGTTNPAVELNVIGSIQASSNVVVGSGSFLKFGNSANTIRGGLNYLLFKTNSVDQLMIDASGFVGIGTTLPTKKLDIAGDINLTGTIFSNGNSGSSGQVLSSTGTGLAWISGTGTTYSAGTGLTLSATNIFSLNLGNTNIWLAPQFFGNGVGVTGNLTIGGTFVSVGSTNLVTNLNANYLNGIPSSSFLQTGFTGFDNYRNWAVNVGTSNLTIGTTSTLSFATGAGLSATLIGNTITFTNTGVGTTYSFTNGLTNSTGIVSLGGTLTQNTTIGTSSFGLSFLGLGNSQSLFIGTSGFVGIGTTNPHSNLEVVGTNSTSSYGADIITNGSFGVGTGWSGTPTSWVISGGTIAHTVGNTTPLQQAFSTTEGMYYVTFITNYTSGTLSVSVGSSPSKDVTVSGMTSMFLPATNDTNGIQFFPSSNWNGTIDDITVQKINSSQSTVTLHNDQGTSAGNQIDIRLSQYNMFFGENSGKYTISSAGDNISLGGNSLKNLVSGWGNIAIGNNYDYNQTSGVLGKLSSGNGNTVIGAYAGQELIQGNSNTIIGESAGRLLTNNSSGNVLIGNAAGSDLVDANNVLYIANTSGTPLIFGDFDNARVGLGTTNPIAKLDIVGDINLTGTIVANGTTGSNGQILSSTGTGLAWISGTGTTYTFTNGLTNTTNTISLGGTLTQNTTIGTSSFDLSFLGLGNSQSLFIGASGYVGIGTTNPQAPLDIALANSNIVMQLGSSQNSTYGFKLLNSTGSYEQTINPSGIFSINKTGQGESFSINYPDITLVQYIGNVGIGITNPSKKLDIAGDIKLTGTLFVGAGVTGSSGQVLASNGAGSLQWISGTGTTYAFTNGLTNSTNTVSLGGTLTQNTTIGTSSFSLSITGLGGTQALFVGNSGKVAIGSTTQNATLSVNNNAPALSGYDLLTLGDHLGNTYFSVNGFGGLINATPSITIGNTLSAINFGDSNLSISSAGTVFKINSGSVGSSGYSFRVQENSTDYLVVNGDGNIGLGTTAPSKKLDVAGDIKLTGTLFVGAGVTGSSGQVLASNGAGSLQWISGTGTTYSAGTGLTLSATNIFSLNLGSTNIWTARQYFSGGIGITDFLSVSDSSSSNNIFFVSASGTTISNATSITSHNDSNITLTLYPSSSSGSSLLRAVGTNNIVEIDNNGSLGIGTTAPSKKLDVAGDIKLTGTLFVGAGVTGSSGQVLASNGAGSLQWISGTGTTYSAGTGLTLSATNIFSLNLGNTNIWLAPQFFGNGVGVTGNLTIGGTFVSVGSTNLVTNLNANYLNGIPSSSFLQTGFTGAINTAINGLQKIGSTAIGLGGTLNQATQIGTSSFGLSFLGLGNSQSLFVGASGYVGIGTTNPSKKLDVVGDIELSGTLFVGAGVTGSSGQVLASNGAGSLQWTTVSAGTTYSFTNGLTNSANTIGLGGTLTQNTTIGTSSFGLSYLGLGNSQSLFIGASGYVGIGTTNPSKKLDIAGDIKLTGTLFVGAGVTGSSGQVLSSNGAGSLSWITPSGASYSFTNGLTSIGGGNTLGLGGTLTQNTTIGTSSFGLSFLGLGNSQSLFIGASGYVGIGTTNPGYKLELAGDVNNYLGYIYNIGTSSSSGGLSVRSDGSGNVFNLNSSGTDLLTVSPVQTTINNPVSFTSSGNISSAYDLVFTNTTSSSIKSSAPLNIQSGEIFNSSNLNLTTFNSGELVLDTPGGVVLNQAQNWTLGTGTTSTIALNIQSGLLNFDTTNSRVGIGTTAPSKKLDVTGDIKLTGTLFVGAGVTGSSGQVLSSNGAGSLSWITPGGATYTAGNGITMTGTVIGLGGSLTQNTTIGTSSFGLSFLGLGNSQSLFIGASGYVGIGTTDPLELLQVGSLTTPANIGLVLSNTAGAIRWYNSAGTPINSIRSLGTTEMAFTVNSQERMRINSSGYVGIGNTNPIGTLQVSVGSSQSFIVASNGRVGIGNSSPAYQLDVAGNVAGGIAFFKNLATGASNATVVIQTSVGQGTTQASNAGEYIRFLNSNGVKTGRIRVGGTAAVAFATSGANDLAEFVIGSEPTQSGDLITFNGDKFAKATPGSVLAGIHSSYATLIGRESLMDEPNAFPLAISGIVQLKVSSENGPIHPGDPLAGSSFTGIAAKAIKPGQIVARALNSYTDSNPNHVGTIEVIAGLNWFDPDVYLTETGQINVNHNISDSVLISLGYNASKNEIESAQYNLADSLGHPITKISHFAQISSAKIKAGLISTTNLIAKNIIAETTKSKKIQTAVISPLSDISDTIVVEGNLEANNITADSATINSLQATEATFSTLYADNIISKEGNFGTLMSDKITALRNELRSTIANLGATAPESSQSALVAESSNWNFNIGSSHTEITGSLSLTDNMQIGAKLTVLGDSQLGNAFVTGTFTAGEIAIKENYLETTAANLYFQPSGLGNVDIMNHTLIIAENGEVTVNGNFTASGKITSPSLFANLIEADEIKTKKISTEVINVATASATPIIAESRFAALATSSASLSSNASAGTVVLPAGKTELIINNSKINSNSIVYLTPAGSTGNQVVYLKSKFISPTPSTTPESTSSATTPSSFTLAIDQSLPTDLTVNYWIIN